METMKQKYYEITGVEMASDDQIYTVETGELLTIRKFKIDGEITYRVYLGEEEQDEFSGFRQAQAYRRQMRADKQLLVSGYGKHSGRRFWQLPERIQSKACAASRA